MVRAGRVLVVALLLAGCTGPRAEEAVGPCTVYGADAGGGGYTVGDAGEVLVYLERGELRLVHIRPAPGWESELVTEADGEIEDAFSRGGDRVTFGAVVDDDVLAAHWCP
ncbi:hypothetical protein [Cellulomonas aerilata]|uniref:Lipoprotein n=1 Tax=Cellulomonas aerilata TaxID=515326 RepID=A0A512DE87_9CELL|nr:hypothetical protein [Cellulomonas aerilata]GEO34781.1 hypothetical protein CAE01nite_25060 [Cellulomonas aerilata]